MSESEKSALIILGCIISTFIMMFAIAGGMYLIGNVLIGWTWLTFNICIAISGTMILGIGTIIIFILDRKEDKNE